MEEGLHSLTLIVKAPNQRIEDQRVACDCTWTVGQLKEHLSTVHPDKPHKDKQKLVYFGKLLKDESSLKEVLTQDSYDDAHTVHLVCPSLSYNDNSKPYTPRYSVQPPQVNELRQRLVASTGDEPPFQPSAVSPQSTQQWNSSNLPQMFPMHMQQSSQMTAQQQLWLRMYQQQWQQYNAMMQQQLYGQHLPVPSQTAPAPQAAVVAADAPPAGGAEQNDVVQMNAQGGVDPGQGQQDWLDTMYAIVRFGMLLLLLYFYTTMGRFAIVIIVGVFFYLAQGNLFRNLFRLQRRRPEARVAPQQPQQNEQNQAENQNNENNERYQSEAGAAENESADNVVTEQTSTWLDGVKVICTFIVTFFTSLIPQNPAAIAN